MGTNVVRAVINTSALVPKSSRQDLQQMADIGLHEAVWSSWIIAELNRVLTIRWLKASDCDLSHGALQALSAAAKSMMRVMLGTFIHIDPQLPYPEPWDTFADDDDAPIWAAAVASGSGMRGKLLYREVRTGLKSLHGDRC